MDAGMSWIQATLQKLIFNSPNPITGRGMDSTDVWCPLAKLTPKQLDERPSPRLIKTLLGMDILPQTLLRKKSNVFLTFIIWPSIRMSFRHGQKFGVLIDFSHQFLFLIFDADHLHISQRKRRHGFVLRMVQKNAGFREHMPARNIRRICRRIYGGRSADWVLLWPCCILLGQPAQQECPPAVLWGRNVGKGSTFLTLICTICYDRLHLVCFPKSPKLCVERMAEFLGCTADENFINHVTEAISFEALRKLDESQQNRENGNAFFRFGKHGALRNLKIKN